jgi:thioredoxin-like negative regulator of GroEL
MNTTDITQLQALMRSKDWDAVYAMLDDAGSRAVTQEDMRREVYWRATAFEGEQRYDEALELLQKNADLFDCQCLVHLQLACILIKLGRDQDALDELRKAPIEAEMEDYYGLAIDAKFLYFYLLAKIGDPSVKDRLAEIPDDYRHITSGGKFLTKTDISSFL